MTLVSYNYKHNEANGENNEDGSCYNYSWNCGVEGPSRKQWHYVRCGSARCGRPLPCCCFPRGLPCFTAATKSAIPRMGNNNAYCQDNPIGWIDWRGLRKNASMLGLCEKRQWLFEKPIRFSILEREHERGRLSGQRASQTCPSTVSGHGSAIWKTPAA